ncbi:MAG: DUF1080 domain-containing protein [Planctomycetia bacterium]|nr:DUF1080 domain-containing protein [Planctomycetia bacterium]
MIKCFARRCVPKMAICCTLVLVSATTLSAAEPAWEDVFNGRDIVGWVVEGNQVRKDGEQTVPVWTVADGELRCGGGGFGFLRLERRVCDFALKAEFRLAKGANSGIGIRTVPYRNVRQTRPSFAAYELQLQDDAGKPADDHSTGSLYRYVAPTSNPIKPAGAWNTVEVECVGPRIVVRLNGQQVQDVDQSKIDEIKDKPLCGYVCLQNHGTPVTFRRVQLREIKGSQ